MAITPAQVHEWDRLLTWQEELESSSLSKGAEEFRRKLEVAETRGNATTIGGTKKLLREGMGRMTVAIQAMIDKPQGRGHGPKHLAARWCQQLGPEVAAFITLKMVVSAASGGKKGREHAAVAEVARSIWQLFVDELVYRRLREQHPRLFEYKLRNFQTTSYSHMARSMSATVRFAEVPVEDLKLPPGQGERIGIKMIDLLMEATGLVERGTVRMMYRGKPHSQAILRFTEETEQWIEAYNSELALLQPIVLPMVVPPLAWGEGVGGGFRFALRDRFPLIRGSKMHNMGRQLGGHASANASLPLVTEAVNALQNTAWRINPRVFATVQALREAGGGIAGLPLSQDMPLPAKPQDIATNEEARRQWKKRAGETKTANAIRRQRVRAVERVVSAAAVVKESPAIFFPHSCDFRGRVYPIATHFSPQGNDLAKGLLTFADGKPLDRDGARWLAIHGANCLGETPEGGKVAKMTFDERVEWIVGHSNQIGEAAAHPLVATWWATAEDPLQFLAFCFEWTALLEAQAKGEVFVSTLPCSMDGSCNGLQHFAAMFRDEVGARAVNIVAADRPQDVYQLVADTVLRRLTESDDPVALEWLGLHHKIGIANRKLTKRPTMTFGYGSKQYGFAEQVAQFLREHDQHLLIKEHFTGENGQAHIGTAARFMSGVIWAALGDIIGTAFDGMLWMQQATRGITRRNRQVRWTVPFTGFRVEQKYRHYRTQQVHTILAGSTISPTLYHDTDRVHKVKQANAIAPNYVHSLDAAALMLTIHEAALEGIEQFAMIHDSYGTVAQDCALMARICRQAFARLYSEVNVVELLHRELAGQWQVPEECPPPPVLGDLEVSQVHGSSYFFA